MQVIASEIASFIDAIYMYGVLNEFCDAFHFKSARPVTKQLQLGGEAAVSAKIEKNSHQKEVKSFCFLCVKMNQQLLPIIMRF